MCHAVRNTNGTAAACSKVKSSGIWMALYLSLIHIFNSATEAVSIARMESPAGWSEPGQTPEFDEYTVVLRGLLRVETNSTVIDVKAGQAITAHRGEWVRYSTPEPGGAEYIAVCIPAFAPGLVHREPS